LGRPFFLKISPFGEKARPFKKGGEAAHTGVLGGKKPPQYTTGIISPHSI